MSRDNFAKKTIDTLAQRVGFICSNPVCKAHTVGPNSQPDKATRIGKAAHVSAASNGGPRFREALSPAERSHISNGIWLCANCADLIDKDEAKYTIEVLNTWKLLAEMESSERIKANNKPNDDPFDGPYLEADLIRDRYLRLNEGYSDKNPAHMENGVYVVDIGNRPIVHWVLTWIMKLTIHNNSSFPAYNISVNPLTEIDLLTKETFPRVNNLQAFDHKTLKITYQERLEDQYTEADRRLSKLIPEGIDGMSFEINYFDDRRRAHRTTVKVMGQQVINEKG